MIYYVHWNVPTYIPSIGSRSALDIDGLIELFRDIDTFTGISVRNLPVTIFLTQGVDHEWEFSAPGADIWVYEH